MAQVAAQINWAFWLQAAFVVGFIVVLNQFGGLSLGGVFRTIVSELRDLLKLKPTVGALNAVCVIAMICVLIVLVTAPAVEDVFRGALALSKGSAPEEHDNVPTYVFLTLTVMTMLGSIFAARS